MSAGKGPGAGTAWAPALSRDRDREGRAPGLLSACPNAPGRVWHSGAVASLVTEKSGWPPCRGTGNLIIHAACPIHIASGSERAPHAPRPVFGSDVGLLTVPLSSHPSNLPGSFLAMKTTLAQCRTPGSTGKKPMQSGLLPPTSQARLVPHVQPHCIALCLLFAPTLQNLSLSFFWISSSHGGFFPSAVTDNIFPL